MNSTTILTILIFVIFINAYFGTFWVQIGQLLDPLSVSVFEHLDSKKSLIHGFRREIGMKVELSRIFKDSMRLWLLTNFESNDTKRSMNISATNLSKMFFKNIFSNVSRRSSKIRSLHSYVVLWIHWRVANFNCNCMVRNS